MASEFSINWGVRNPKGVGSWSEQKQPAGGLSFCWSEEWTVLMSVVCKGHGGKTCLSTWPLTVAHRPHVPPAWEKSCFPFILLH